MNSDSEKTDDMERYNCPICFSLPEKEVYQCSNGHLLCDKCSAKQKTNCPQCRVSIRGQKRSRNRFMEETLDKLQVDCPFSDNGCVKKMKRGELTEHRSSCMFGKTVSLCKLLRFENCNFEVNMGNLREFAMHLEIEHEKEPSTSIIGRSGVISRKKLEGFFHPGDRVYSMVLEFGCLATILFVAKQEGDFVSWIFLDLWSGEDLNDGTQMQIELWSDQTPNTSWKIPVFPVLDAEAHFKGPIVKTSVPNLKLIRVQPPSQSVEHYGIYDYIVNFRSRFQK